jgi:hypothetical protein
MRFPLPTVAALAVVMFTSPAPRTEAHYLWLEAEPPVVRLYFSEIPDPGEPGLIGRVEHTRLFANGQALAVTTKSDHLQATLPEIGATAVDAVCDYGLITRNGQRYQLQYAARTQLHPEADDTAPPELTHHPRLIWLTTAPGTTAVAAVWRGKPLPGAAVKVFADDPEPLELTTDAAGLVPFAPAPGTAWLLKVVEPIAEARGDDAPSETRHYATLTLGEASPSTAADSPEPDSADAVLQRAHQARACWGPSFPGFTADIVVRGEQLRVSGKLDVSSDGTVTLDLPPGPPRDWASSQLRSLVMHRGLNGPTELEPGAKFLEPESDHPLGRLIQLSDDRMGSAYRIKADQILEVNRTMGDRKFSNRILANTRNPEGKLLPLAFTVAYWNVATGKLERVETFHDTWTRVGHLDLPVTHTQITAADGTSSVKQLELSNHQLKPLSPQTAAAP